MKCSFCGGYVEWKGPLSNLTHTECHSCGAVNCQELEHDAEEDFEEESFFPQDDLADSVQELYEHAERVEAFLEDFNGFNNQNNS
jgi:hypothetical protein